MHTKFTALSHRRCTVTYVHPEGGVRTDEYIAPEGGGYVELFKNGSTSQVCRQLAGHGAALRWDGKAPLVDLIRAEWRAMQRAQQREDARWANSR